MNEAKSAPEPLVDIVRRLQQAMAVKDKARAAVIALMPPTWNMGRFTSIRSAEFI